MSSIFPCQRVIIVMYKQTFFRMIQIDANTNSSAGLPDFSWSKYQNGEKYTKSS
jgi:hypothetical protein